MQASASLPPMLEARQDRLAATTSALLPRLRAFVRRRIGNLSDAEDIVQDALYELVAAADLAEPIANVSAWLLRVARNRIIDRYRARAAAAAVSPTEPPRLFEELLEDLPAPAAEDPEAAYQRAVLLEEFTHALNALPPEQREVFIAHEFDGRSFKELAGASGESINTLLGRKHAAVLQLRRRLAALRADFQF